MLDQLRLDFGSGPPEAVSDVPGADAGPAAASAAGTPASGEGTRASAAGAGASGAGADPREPNQEVSQGDGDGIPGRDVIRERSRPVARKVKLYIDGAARGNPGPAAAAAVLTTPKGLTVSHIGRYLGARTNNYAEYSALIAGLSEAAEVGATEVRVLSDSQLLVRQMQGAYKVKKDTLRPLHERANQLASAFKKVTYRHIEREYNKEADRLANEVLDRQALKEAG